MDACAFHARMGWMDSRHASTGAVSSSVEEDAG